jgi:NAD(P)-dependent dehydrogenase (short-subunit alcohol dehydrogenase family)
VALPAVELTGRTALELGGGRGDGAAIAELLGAAGAEVTVADGDPAALARTAARTAFATVECDLADPAAVVALLAARRERGERLDLLALASSPASAEVAADCVEEAARGMAGTGGRIVLVGPAGESGVSDLVGERAAALAAQRIALNAVLAGPIRGELSEAELAARAAANPSAMAGEPADVARAALWLLDPENAFVAGATILVDGAESSLP